ncbi:MAG: hypothetical protein IMZ53_06650 [Thermoplasmata archaeon]|nr:hypothetical protein [Thermoplasmata archaeon]
MNEPWKDEPKIWAAFCNERSWNYLHEHTKELFRTLRSAKDEYEWFKKGYLAVSTHR